MSYPNSGANDTSHLKFENKYFSASVPVYVHDYGYDLNHPGPFAVVVVYSSGCKEFIDRNAALLDNSECNILFYNDHAEPFEEDSGLEVVVDTLDTFSEFRKDDGEFVGVGRIKEALECACASFVRQNEKDKNSPANTSDPINEADQTKIEKDIENFEYFLNKIKQNCENSKTCDDQTRRKNAEETIRELVEYLKLEDEDEDYIQ